MELMPDQKFSSGLFHLRKVFGGKKCMHWLHSFEIFLRSTQNSGKLQYPSTPLAKILWGAAEVSVALGEARLEGREWEGRSQTFVHLISYFRKKLSQ